jgi:hypothetical protein
MKELKKDKKKTNLTDEPGAVDETPPKIDTNLTDEPGAVDETPPGDIAPTIADPPSPEEPLSGLDTEYSEINTKMNKESKIKKESIEMGDFDLKKPRK